MSQPCDSLARMRESYARPTSSQQFPKDEKRTGASTDLRMHIALVPPRAHVVNSSQPGHGKVPTALHSGFSTPPLRTCRFTFGHSSFNGIVVSPDSPQDPIKLCDRPRLGSNLIGYGQVTDHRGP